MLTPQKPPVIERALIGTDCRGVPVILATDGESIAWDAAENGCNAHDIGLVSHERFSIPGLYLWEGFGRLEYENHESTTPTEWTYHGSVRPVLPEEIEALYAMEPPAEERESCP